jgi:hypothetical protein
MGYHLFEIDTVASEQNVLTQGYFMLMIGKPCYQPAFRIVFLLQDVHHKALGSTIYIDFNHNS